MRAQAVFTKSWVAADAEHITIELPFSASFELSNTEDNSIQLQYFSEGEYQEQLGIKSQIEDGILFLREYLNPLFRAPNDKLGAHKVIATKLFLSVPKNSTVRLKMQQGLLKASGEFSQLQLALNSGECQLNLENTSGLFKSEFARLVLHSKQMQVRQLPSGKPLACSNSKSEAQFEIITERNTVDCFPR